MASPSIFISSVQRELAVERRSEVAVGISPTQREFERATLLGKPRLIFVKRADDGTRHPKMAALVRMAEEQVVRRRFDSVPELTTAHYASLVEHLERTGAVRTKPFDASACPEATFDDLRRPHASIPRNPLLAEPLFLAHYAEKAGSGILDMFARLQAAGLPEPKFSQSGGQFVQTVSRVRPASATEVATEVAPELRLLHALTGEMTRQQLQAALQLKNDEHFRKAYLQPALQAGLIERTVPDKPQSRLQKYRRTTKGVEELARRATGADSSAGQDRDRDQGQK